MGVTKGRQRRQRSIVAKAKKRSGAGARGGLRRPRCHGCSLLVMWEGVGRVGMVIAKVAAKAEKHRSRPSWRWGNGTDRRRARPCIRHTTQTSRVNMPACGESNCVVIRVQNNTRRAPFCSSNLPSPPSLPKALPHGLLPHKSKLWQLSHSAKLFCFSSLYTFVFVFISYRLYLLLPFCLSLLIARNPVHLAVVAHVS